MNIYIYLFIDVHNRSFDITLQRQSEVWAGRPQYLKIISVKLSSMILGGGREGVFVSFTQVNLKIWAHFKFCSCFTELSGWREGGFISFTQVNLKIWARFKFCSCFTELSGWREGGLISFTQVNLKIWARFKFCSCFTELFHFYL